jgi:hypothetical protein
MAIEDGVFRAAMEVGLRCKLVLTCGPGCAPRRMRKRIEGDVRWRVYVGRHAATSTMYY